MYNVCVCRRCGYPYPVTYLPTYLCVDQEEYQLGTLSHAINARANDYRDLPRWPLTQPDPSVRTPDTPPVITKNHESGDYPRKPQGLRTPLIRGYAPYKGVYPYRNAIVTLIF